MDGRDKPIFHSAFFKYSMASATIKSRTAEQRDHDDGSCMRREHGDRMHRSHEQCKVQVQVQVENPNMTYQSNRSLNVKKARHSTAIVHCSHHSPARGAPIVCIAVAKQHRKIQQCLLSTNAQVVLRDCSKLQQPHSRRCPRQATRQATRLCTNWGI